MRCLHPTCPMGNRNCPAMFVCDEVQPAPLIRLPDGSMLYLTTNEAKAMIEQLEPIAEGNWEK